MNPLMRVLKDPSKIVFDLYVIILRFYGGQEKSRRTEEAAG